jgi:hypothetical protein
MRDAEKQADFLKHGRFGEGEETPGRTKVDEMFWIGLLLLLAAAAVVIVPTVVSGPGRFGGGPLFLMVFIASGVAGALLCICGLVRMRSR